MNTEYKTSDRRDRRYRAESGKPGFTTEAQRRGVPEVVIDQFVLRQDHPDLPTSCDLAILAQSVVRFCFFRCARDHGVSP
jgi:hypothetical protein